MILYFHETDSGIIEQATIIDGQRIRLADFVPGAVYKSTGRPPVWYPHPELGWLEFNEAVRC